MRQVPCLPFPLAVFHTPCGTNRPPPVPWRTTLYVRAVAHRQGPRGSTGASSSAAAATTTRTVRVHAVRRARRSRRRAPSGPTRLDGRVVCSGGNDGNAHRQGPRGSTGASSTTTCTVRAHAARRARRRRQRRRRRASSGPTQLEGRVVDNDVHRQGRTRLDGASLAAAETTTRTVGAHAARRARRCRLRRRRRHTSSLGEIGPAPCRFSPRAEDCAPHCKWGRAPTRGEPAAALASRRSASPASADRRPPTNAPPST